MDKATLKRRVHRADGCLKAINAFCKSLNKIPSFTGKARFVDKVLRAKTYAHNPHWDLEHDLAEWR
jgi:hypothetical protein